MILFISILFYFFFVCFLKSSIYNKYHLINTNTNTNKSKNKLKWLFYHLNNNKI